VVLQRREQADDAPAADLLRYIHVAGGVDAIAMPTSVEGLTNESSPPPLRGFGA
jgi:hypothetical protein